MKTQNNIQATGIFAKSAVENFDYNGVIATLNNSQRDILRERIERVFTTARNVVETHHRVSAWERGVRATALDLIDKIEENALYSFDNYNEFPKIDEAFALNGASDWQQYSWGGSALIYNVDIAERFCTPSELKRVTGKGGLRMPNSREDWLDVQARALRQAWRLISWWLGENLRQSVWYCLKNEMTA